MGKSFFDKQLYINDVILYARVERKYDHHSNQTGKGNHLLIIR